MDGSHESLSEVVVAELHFMLHSVGRHSGGGKDSHTIATGHAVRHAKLGE